MSTVLRAAGVDFAIDSFTIPQGWRVDARFRKGDPVLASRPQGRKRQVSGMNILVSEAGFTDFPQQIADAIRFLADNMLDVRRLASVPAACEVELDFGVAIRDVAVQSDTFPAALVRLAGECGIGLTISHYPVSDD